MKMKKMMSVITILIITLISGPVFGKDLVVSGSLGTVDVGADKGTGVSAEGSGGKFLVVPEKLATTPSKGSGGLTEKGAVAEGDAVAPEETPGSEAPADVEAEIVIDYEGLCVGSTVIAASRIRVPPEFENIFNTMDLAIGVDNDGNGVVDAKLLCFDGEEILSGEEGYDGTLTITSTLTNPLPIFIHNMNTKMAEGAQIVIGNDVTLDHLRISGSVVNPISIYGSNSKILNSEIHASGIAVSINDTENISIDNTIISGPGEHALGLTGVKIKDSNGIKICENGGGFERFETGIDGASDTHAYFGLVATPISNDGFAIDPDRVGEKVQEDGEYAIFRGLAPAGLDSCHGIVRIYDLQTIGDGEAYSVFEDCHVEISTDKLCIDQSAERVENREECEMSDTCECFDAGSCVFECSDVAARNNVVKFGYIDSDGISYTLSERSSISDLGDIIATSFIPEFDSPESSSGMTGGGPGIDDAGGVAGGGSGGATGGSGPAPGEDEEGADGTTLVGAGGPDQGGTAVAGPGPNSPVTVAGGGASGMFKAGGCSLAPNTRANHIPASLIPLLLLAVPVAVRVRIKNKDK